MTDWTGINGEIKSSKELSDFKKKYLLRLVKFAEEFENCGRTRAAELMHARILGQMKVRSNRYSRVNFRGNLDFQEVAERMHTAKVDDAISFLEKNSDCLPEQESKIFKYQIMAYKEPEAGGEELTPEARDYQTLLPEIQKERINSLRDAMLEKVVRFRQKQKIQKSVSHISDAELPEVVGIYNNKFNICEVLDHLSGIDSEFVDDLKGHYQKLSELKNLFR